MLFSLLRSSKWDSVEASGRTVKGASSSRGHSLKHRAEGHSKPIKHYRLGGLLMTPHLLVQPGMRCVTERDCVKREMGLVGHNLIEIISNVGQKCEHLQ